ncbi:MAG: HPr family phosphocarrier protein [Hyphomonadaceae bacterium]
MGQVSQFVTIVNKKGLHARASAAFAKVAVEYGSKVTVKYDGLEVSAGHIMDLMMLVAHKGSEIEIVADGVDAEAALEALVALVSDGFGELARDRSEETQSDTLQSDEP